MLSPLATIADGETFGYAGLSVASLTRASARVRGHLRQEISRRSSTVTGMGPSITLPEGPINSIASVKDSAGADVYYVRYGQRIDTDRCITLSVTYDHGVDALPDEMVELVCAVAARIEASPDAITQGVQTQAAGPMSITYGMDAQKAQAGLTAGEKAALQRIWPRIPRTYSMSSPAEAYPLDTTHTFGQTL